MNENELLDILERITLAQFAKLVFLLQVPKNLMPAEDKELTLRAIALLEWAQAPGGSGLEKIQQTLAEMGITTTSAQERLAEILDPIDDFKKISRIYQQTLGDVDNHQLKNVNNIHELLKNLQEIPVQAKHLWLMRSPINFLSVLS